jgi:hypothetical protein
LIGLRERQRIEQHAVDYRKECDVGADTQREGQHDYGTEAGVFKQHPQAKS